MFMNSRKKHEEELYKIIEEQSAQIEKLIKLLTDVMDGQKEYRKKFGNLYLDLVDEINLHTGTTSPYITELSNKLREALNE